MCRCASLQPGRGSLHSPLTPLRQGLFLNTKAHSFSRAKQEASKPQQFSFSVLFTAEVTDINKTPYLLHGTSSQTPVFMIVQQTLLATEPSFWSVLLCYFLDFFFLKKDVVCMLLFKWKIYIKIIYFLNRFLLSRYEMDSRAS